MKLQDFVVTLFYIDKIQGTALISWRMCNFNSHVGVYYVIEDNWRSNLEDKESDCHSSLRAKGTLEEEPIKNQWCNSFIYRSALLCASKCSGFQGVCRVHCCAASPYQVVKRSREGKGEAAPRSLVRQQWRLKAAGTLSPVTAQSQETARKEMQTERPAF